MFMDVGKSESPPIAEGAYWAFMPVAIALATPLLTRLAAALLDQALAPPVLQALDQFQALFQQSVSFAREAATAVLPAGLLELAPNPVNEVFLFSFAGAAYIAGWLVAGFQRGLGWIAGLLLALVLTFCLGVSLLGFGVLLVAYWLLADDGFLFFLLFDEPNDRAILVPLLVPVLLAAAMIIGSRLA